jgi:peptidyl-tRNA hydrolase
MDVELIGTFVNAVHRTHIDAGTVLRILAGFSYDVGHFVPDRAAVTPAW